VAIASAVLAGLHASPFVGGRAGEDRLLDCLLVFSDQFQIAGVVVAPAAGRFRPAVRAWRADAGLPVGDRIFE
jgi:hypothetical protein